ncbi:hypothetical protein TWF569_008972 [Orbilia oligospora]|uniref:Uncharacterized protein n=1 Tax=Orbilia oligospora TaxID=2813651 RepID=A0A7C8J9L3_ORBOL|nr:hypothetical protein TWF102_010548 [Orbilia oligospora]KAF3097945.1 hypothetical protein TWF706_006893 [Orbilia oligospora]KAF3105846.1 hypothetical protein TWF103_006545 [Orbilia oligospora]KAF3105847.1 hypothetical protein TWF103_006545 [Orbilia oligospora]KAF3145405.1 hypothetical protein TWF594_004347 [Orbilia oligospora]
MLVRKAEESSDPALHWKRPPHKSDTRMRECVVIYPKWARLLGLRAAQAHVNRSSETFTWSIGYNYASRPGFSPFKLQQMTKYSVNLHI